MAEVVGLVASIIALTKLSAKVSSLTYAYITGVKRAPEELKRLSNELKSLTAVLNSLQAHTQEYSESIALQLLGDPLQQCLEELTKLQSGLEPETRWLRKTLSRLKRPFGLRETLEYISQVERFKTLFILALNADQLSRSKAIAENVQRIEEQGQSEKHNQVLNWVYPDEFDTRHREISGKRRKNTGGWILKTSAVQDLIQNKDQGCRLLWGYGIPGAGKTFLSSLVIDHLLAQAQSSSYGVAYIYFNFKEQEQQKPEHVLGSLLKQLATQAPDTHFSKGLEVAYNQKKRPTLEQLYTILLAVTKSFEQTFIICDALDECQQGAQRTELLPLFHRMAQDGIGLFLTSREHPEDIQHSFKDTNKIRLSAQDDDIASYIEQKIDENPRAKRLVGQANCKDRIISDLKACANGMFLLVHFHIEYLCQQTTVKQILAELERLKSSSNEQNPMSPTYNRAMEMLRAQPKSCVDLAFRVLAWLVKGRRVLTVRELQLAVSVPLESDSFIFDELDLPDRKTLLDVCASLITIDREADTVRLVHYTVQEYILANQIITPNDAHFQLAIACTNFLSYDVFAQRVCTCERRCGCPQNLQKLYPFLGYAANELPFHLKEVNEALTAESIFRLLSCPGSISSYVEAREDYWQQENSTALHAAATLGNSNVIRRVLEELVIDINSRDSKGQTPLSDAAYAGQELVVRLLLEKGADISSQDTAGYTPLHEAVRGGHELIVGLLLEKGADISSTRNDGSTPLHSAASGGHESVVRLLLEKGADISSTCNDGDTPLHRAALGGHESVVRLLLEKGADISSTRNDGSTPLHEAVLRGHESVVRLLLEKGADISSTCDGGSTPLHMAASGGRESVVRLLLEKGADISSTRNDGDTPLHRAAWGEHAPTILLLLKNGADVSAANKEGKIPRDHAYGESVILLLETAMQTQTMSKTSAETHPAPSENQ